MRRHSLAVAMLIAVPLHAQTLPGYTAPSSARERAVEADVVSKPAGSNAAVHSRFLSQQPHMAGTPAQARTRDYVIAQMRSWGLETEVRSYRVWMPYPLNTHVW